MTEQHSLETARENLLYIRRTLEAAGQLTALSGKSLIATGLIAIGGTALNHYVTQVPWRADDPYPALSVWFVVLVISITVVLRGFYKKSLRMGAPIQAPLVRKLLWSLCPALFLGAVLTYLAIRSTDLEWLPVIWLGCYGAAVSSGAQVSVAPVRYMGLSFLIAAAGAALSPTEAGLAWLALGFGWLHIVYGAYIVRRYHG